MKQLRGGKTSHEDRGRSRMRWTGRCENGRRKNPRKEGGKQMKVAYRRRRGRLKHQRKDSLEGLRMAGLKSHRYQ